MLFIQRASHLRDGWRGGLGGHSLSTCRCPCAGAGLVYLSAGLSTEAVDNLFAPLPLDVFVVRTVTWNTTCTAFETTRNTMTYTLRDAAEATGKSKPTILRAIQAHKISARKDIHGEWEIDPAELHRVYDPIDPADPEEASGDTDALHVEVRLLRELLAEREKRVGDQATVIEGLEEVISDLMARLDQEAADRRRAYAQLTGLLTDQSAGGKAPTIERSRWWPW